MIQKNIHQLVGDVNGFISHRRQRAKKAVKKTAQIGKLHRLFVEGKKTLEELIYGLSYLVGEPAPKRKKKGN